MWINAETKTIYTLLYEVRQAVENISLPEHISDSDLEPFGIFPLVNSPTPAYDPITQGYREVTPTQDSLGNWMRAYEVYDLDPEQAAANLAAKNERIKNDIVTQTQARLDTFAKTRGYDGILSLATYATSTVPKFATEGQYGVQLRDATWAKLYEIMAEVEAGTRPSPEGFADIETLLPVLEWPTE